MSRELVFKPFVLSADPFTRRDQAVFFNFLSVGSPLFCLMAVVGLALPAGPGWLVLEKRLVVGCPFGCPLVCLTDRQLLFAVSSLLVVCCMPPVICLSFAVWRPFVCCLTVGSFVVVCRQLVCLSVDHCSRDVRRRRRRAVVLAAPLSSARYGLGLAAESIILVATPPAAA
ncbi:MAG: hypothetical protein LBP95_01250 [Deltaproteobacteria bacterium]|nr:hypothetical protein [Deltaproteobacteria bacterium]